MPRESIDPRAAAIGGVLRAIREKRGWTQAEVAAKLDLKSKQTVADWEAGRRCMPLTRLPSLAVALNENVGKLADQFVAAFKSAGLT